MSKLILCQYFIQNEETKSKSKKQLNNAFVLNKKVSSVKEVRVADIKSSFPFNVDDYHFRFQTKINNVKVWVDTSKDTVAAPSFEGEIRIKLLKLPAGVRPKTVKAAPPSAEKVSDDIFGKPAPAASEPVKHNDYMSPQKHKHIHHSNSQNNIADSHKSPSKKNGHKPMSHSGHEDDLIGGFDDEDHHSQNLNHHDMHFNLDSDDILGNIGTGGKQQSNPPPRNPDHDNLLGDFDTHHSTPQTQPPKQDSNFDLAAGLGDLGGLDFSMDPNKANAKKEEEKKAPQSLIDHVAEVHSTSEKEKVEWHKAYQKYDHKLKLWKGAPVQNSVKVLV